MSPLQSLADYESFIYTLKRRYSSIHRSTLVVIRRGASVAVLSGEIELNGEYRIVVRVQQRPGVTGQPDDLIGALGFDDYARTLRREQLYLNSVEADVALFAAYSVVEKQDIDRMGEKVRKRPCRGKNAPQDRTISERAGDEFV